MSFKGFAFKTFFGGKPWYKSMVGWGLVVLTVAETAIPLVGELGLADPEQMSTLTSYMEKLAIALAALGIRRRLPATGTIAAVSLVALLSMGCADVSIITRLPDKPPVTVDAHLGGRGAISAVVDPKTGKVEVTLCQDGTSDWILGRLFAVFGNLAAKMLAPIPILGDAVKMQGPSGVSGCDGLLPTKPSAPETVKSDGAVYELVPLPPSPVAVEP